MDMVLYLFRRDLRLLDNKALHEACQNPLVFLAYIIDEEDCIGEAYDHWRRQSVDQLQASLGGRIAIFQGKTLEILERLTRSYPIKKIYVSKLYNRHDLPSAILGIEVISCMGNVLWQPEKTYQVFTHFYKYFLQKDVDSPLPKVEGNFFYDPKLSYDACSLQSLVKDVDGAGESKAMHVLQHFLATNYSHYKEKRDLLGAYHCSLLSRHLAHGEISPRTIYHACDKDDPFVRQLVWREFSYHLLHFFPAMERLNFQTKFDAFPWLYDEDNLNAWKFGETGIPIVDAAQKQLLQEGYVHNRARMVSASFLTKNLRMHWTLGEQWYKQHLVDYDLASNVMNWQWVAGTGTDAAPYFRIFSPELQMQKFDPECAYIKKYLPSFRKMTTKEILEGLRPNDYPLPIVDVKKTRQDALQAYKKQMSVA